MDAKTLRKIADQVMRLKKEGWDFRKAGYHVLHSQGIREDASEVLAEVGRLLGKRNRGRKKRSRKNTAQLDFLFGRPREEILAEAASSEASLIAGIPKHDI